MLPSIVLVVGLAACAEPDPVASDAGARLDAAVADAMVDAQPPADANPACQPLVTDYQPRSNGSASDGWAACISDDNIYHPIDLSISTVARVAGFEQIATLLFGGDAPSPQDFIDARLIYLTDNGLESRVSRREDEHYPPAPSACRDLSAAALAAYPDRCVGPVKIQPLLNLAFSEGASGISPERNARIIEAGLLWFLYVSVHKEATTCASAPRDCDSSYAYYTGGEDRSGGLGLARDVRGLAVETHDRIWDGILAVRCWRDLDNPTGPAMNLALRDQAIAQLDRALLAGLSSILVDRTQRLRSEVGVARAADWRAVQLLGAVLDRDARERDATAADTLKAALANLDPSGPVLDAIEDSLASLYPCP